ncbi:MAG: hypothetical protein ACLU0O_08905 [Collinsella sp.]
MMQPDRKPVGARERQGARGSVRAALAVRRLPRAYEDIEARAGEAGIDRRMVCTCAQQLDFGAQQRLNYVSLIRAGGAVTAELR